MYIHTVEYRKQSSGVLKIRKQSIYRSGIWISCDCWWNKAGYNSLIERHIGKSMYIYKIRWKMIFQLYFCFLINICKQHRERNFPYSQRELCKNVLIFLFKILRMIIISNFLLQLGLYSVYFYSIWISNSVCNMLVSISVLPFLLFTSLPPFN